MISLIEYAGMLIPYIYFSHSSSMTSLYNSFQLYDSSTSYITLTFLHFISNSRVSLHSDLWIGHLSIYYQLMPH
jgi:hypothetical protein